MADRAPNLRASFNLQVKAGRRLASLEVTIRVSRSLLYTPSHERKAEASGCERSALHAGRRDEDRVLVNGQLVEGQRAGFVRAQDIHACHLFHSRHPSYDSAFLQDKQRGVSVDRQDADDMHLVSCLPILHDPILLLRTRASLKAPSASVTDKTVGMAMGMPPTMITSMLVRVGHRSAHKPYAPREP